MNVSLLMRRSTEHSTLYIGETEVERMSGFSLLGVHVTEDFTWINISIYTSSEDWGELGIAGQIPRCFCKCAIKSILTSYITVWFRNCTAQDYKTIQQVVRAAQTISGTALTTLESVYHDRVIRRAWKTRHYTTNSFSLQIIYLLLITTLGPYDFGNAENADRIAEVAALGFLQFL